MCHDVLHCPVCSLRTSHRPSSRSRKVYVAQGSRVPMREILLTNGDTLRVYDSSGPQGCDVKGLLETRAPARGVRSPAARPAQAATQLHYARK